MDLAYNTTDLVVVALAMGIVLGGTLSTFVSPMPTILLGFILGVGYIYTTYQKENKKEKATPPTATIPAKPPIQY